MAIIQTLLQLLLFVLLGDILTAPGEHAAKMKATDWLVHVAMAAGWVLGLGVDPSTERARGAGELT